MTGPMTRLFLPLLVLSSACRSPDPEEDTPVPPWPDWAHKHWVWEDESTQDSAMALVDGYLDRDIEVGAIIIDSPWATGYNTFDWDTELFPDPQGMIDAMHDRDVRVFLWVVPAINIDEKELYAEAADLGYFMQKDADSGPAVIDWWKGQGSLIDYFNPEAVEWWHRLVDKSLDMGIDGWKCDGLDFSALLAPYSPGAGREVDRLEYSHAYYQDFHDYTREVLGDDRLITARPIDNYGSSVGGDGVAFSPIDILWAGWVGDQDATFAGLKAALENMYESSEYGYVSFGSDIGGYREDDTYPQGRGKNLFLRWAQLGALNPVMENGGGGDHHPWAWDDETVDIYRQFVRLHHDLHPYLQEHGAIAFEEGGSLMTFEDDIDYAFTLGPDIFVWPLLDDVTEVTVTLPEDGDWSYVFRSAVHPGGSDVTLDVPLDEFPVFVRVGSEADALLQGYRR